MSDKPGAAPATVEKNAPTDAPAVSTKEYVVLDLMLYLMLDDGKGGRRTRKFSQGSTVKLEDKVAANLLRHPRPSVALKTDEESKDG